jgi:hypothetical protein
LNIEKQILVWGSFARTDMDICSKAGLGALPAMGRSFSVLEPRFTLAPPIDFWGLARITRPTRGLKQIRADNPAQAQYAAQEQKTIWELVSFPV